MGQTEPYCQSCGKIDQIREIIKRIDGLICTAKSKTPCAINYRCLLADLIKLRDELAKERP